jgi:DNA-binding transcriptional LysR family regulator
MVMFDKGFGAQSNGFSLERMRRLVAVEESKSILGAAGGDKTTAALISRQIGELEGFFETPLRQKDGKLANLSEAGRELASLTKGFLGALQDFQDRIDGLPPRVVVGAGQSILSNVILPNLRSLSDEAGGARLVFDNVRSEDLPDRLDSGAIDLAIVSENRMAKKKVEKRNLGTVAYELFAPKEFEDRIKAKKPLDAIFKLPFATIRSTGELRRGIDELCRKAKKPLNLQLECSSLLDVAFAVESGSYCSILPTFLRERMDENKVNSYRSPGLKALERKLCVAWKTSVYKYNCRIDFSINAILDTFRRCL